MHFCLFSENNVWNSLLVIKFTFCCMFAVYQMVQLMSDVGSTVQNPLVHETGRYKHNEKNTCKYKKIFEETFYIT